MNFSSSAMKSNQKHPAYALRCEVCEIDFTIAKSRISHIIHIHYGCPWCKDLKSLHKGAWKSILPEDRRARIDHIKQCAQQQKKSSLWLCQQCSALFYDANKDHRCGPRHQINLITNKLLDSEVVAKFESKSICNQCSIPKRFAGALVYKNHVIRQHGMCPWCLLQFSNTTKLFGELSMQERAASVNHLIECAQLNNASLFVCKTCFGVKLSKRCVHIDNLCLGKASKISKKAGIPSETYISQGVELIQGLDSLSPIVVEQEQTVLSILFGEYDNSENIDSCLVSDFFTDNDLQVSSQQQLSQKCSALFHDVSKKKSYLGDNFFTESDFQLNNFIGDTSLFTQNNLTDLEIVHQDQPRKKSLIYEIRCEECKRDFTRAESRVRHILSLHYACPWCNDLKYLEKEACKNICPENRQARVDHIKKCAQKNKNSSLWQCQSCFELFPYETKRHRCGLKAQVNLLSNKVLHAKLSLGLGEKNICHKCPEPKKLSKALHYNNHMICKHAVCPWCYFQFSNEAEPFRKLKLQEREAAVNHLIECALLDEKILFFCNSCFGVKVGDSVAHVERRCKGKVFKGIKKTDRDNKSTLCSLDQ